EGGHDHDRRTGIDAFDAAQDLQTVHPLHSQIGHHHIGGAFGEPPPGQSAVIGDLRGGTCRLENVPDLLGHLTHVVDDQHAPRRVERGVAHPNASRLSATTGHSKVAVVPSPGALARSIWAPWLRTMLAAMGRPSPVPSPRGLVVKNGSNTAWRCS